MPAEFISFEIRKNNNLVDFKNKKRLSQFHNTVLAIFLNVWQI